MGLTRRVAGLRDRFVRSANWARFRDGITAPLGVAGVSALNIAWACHLAGVHVGLREATIAELLAVIALVLVTVSIAREAGASQIGLIALSIGGIALMVLRTVSPEPYGYDAIYIVYFHVVCPNGSGLSKEEFDRLYQRPPERLSTHFSSFRRVESPPPEPDR